MAGGVVGGVAIGQVDERVDVGSLTGGPAPKDQLVLGRGAVHHEPDPVADPRLLRERHDLLLLGHELALPLLFSAMVFMAASFSFRLTRLGGVPQLVVLAVLSGIGVYFLNTATEALGRSGLLPTPLAAVAPALGAILLGMTLLFHEEDG